MLPAFDEFGRNVPKWPSMMLAYPNEGALSRSPFFSPSELTDKRGASGSLKFPRGTFCGTSSPQKGHKFDGCKRTSVLSWCRPGPVGFTTVSARRSSDPFARSTMGCQMTTELASRETLGSSNHSVLSAELPPGPWSALRAQSW